MDTKSVRFFFLFLCLRCLSATFLCCVLTLMYVFDVARICVGTWNVGGRVPPKDLDIDGWVDTIEPADIYVLGYVPFFFVS